MSDKSQQPAASSHQGGLASVSNALQEFYGSHDVRVNDFIPDVDENGVPVQQTFRSRFVRLNPRFDKDETLSLLRSELPTGVPQAVPWLDERLGFYALPGSFSLARSETYRSGRIYGMDISSGAATAALLTNLHPSDRENDLSETSSETFRVLDLCCAPGLKLCTIADFLSSKFSKPSVIIGVDLSEERLALCKRIVRKYIMDDKTAGDRPVDHKRTRIRLYCGDGTKFNPNDSTNSKLVFDSVAASGENDSSGKRKRMNKSARAREKKKLKLIVDSFTESSCQRSVPKSAATDLFDRVLVDAECSTDGSIKHIKRKLAKCESVSEIEDKNKLIELVQLQKQLAASGFGLLQYGGQMIYSTCSLSEDQNEGVVRWLIDKFDEAFIIPVKIAAKAQNCNHKQMIQEGSYPGTVRFSPALPNNDAKVWPLSESDFYGGGFFLAKIGKQRRSSSSGR